MLPRMRNYKPRVLTGDRPTGHLHLGHYVGSLQNRLQIQKDAMYEQIVMIADIQALSDNFATPQKVISNVCNVFCDYLSVGIDPRKTLIFLQSMVPELYELTMHYMSMVTLSRLQRNPTVKAEIVQKAFGSSIPVSFLCYPISQAADITAFDATIVPVGSDQLPMIEQTNEIVRKFNQTYDTNVLQEVSAMLPNSLSSRLVGIDGAAKASKSLNNAIYLSDDSEAIAQKVKSMYTDPLHIKIDDPGNIDGNVVFDYLKIFHPDAKQVEEWMNHYTKGGLGDSFLKNQLYFSLKDLAASFQVCRMKLMQELKIDQEDEALKKSRILELLHDGSAKAREYAQGTLQYVRAAIGIDYGY